MAMRISVAAVLVLQSYVRAVLVRRHEERDGCRRICVSGGCRRRPQSSTSRWPRSAHASPPCPRPRSRMRCMPASVTQATQLRSSKMLLTRSQEIKQCELCVTRLRTLTPPPTRTPRAPFAAKHFRFVFLPAEDAHAFPEPSPSLHSTFASIRRRVRAPSAIVEPPKQPASCNAAASGGHERRRWQANSRACSCL